jgi:hypothetical protein
MTLTTPVRPVQTPQRKTLRERIAERRLLSRRDRLTARLLELHEIAILTERARAVIEGGWVQRGWYRYRDSVEPSDQGERDQEQRSHRIHREIEGACLVGAIVHAGGGRKAFTSQPVQRALDLTWNTLYGVDGDSLAWCPPPAVRLSHARDLTRWNDRPSRTRAEVLDLLTATHAEAERLSELIRSQRNELARA